MMIKVTGFGDIGEDLVIESGRGTDSRALLTP